MTSKISYIKLIRQDMRHRGWIFSVNNIILFLAMPVYAAMRLDVLLDSADSYTELPLYLQEQVTNIFPGLINGCHSMFVFSSIALLAILNAVSGFSYLHSREKQDFYHSLPVKRIQWYITNSLTGLLMFLIPYFICTLLLLLLFGLDLFGYDTWIPREEKISKMAFYPDSFSGYFQYPEAYTASFQNAAYTESIDALYVLAREGVSNLEDGISSKSVLNSSEDGTIPENYINVVFSYQLSSGKTVQREYAVSHKNVLNTLDTLCKNESYRRELFPVFHIKREEIHSMSVSDPYGSEENLKLSSVEISELLDAYEKDALSADILMMDEDTPLGELTAYIPDPYASFLQSDTYKDIMSQLSDSAQFSSYSETDYCVNVSSHDDIAVVLKYVTPCTQYLLGGYETNWNNSADITYKNGNRTSGFFII